MANTISLTSSQIRFIVEHYSRGFVGFFRGYTQETGYVESNWPHRRRSSSASDDRPINVRLICILYFVGLAIAVLIIFVMIQSTAKQSRTVNVRLCHFYYCVGLTIVVIMIVNILCST